MVYGAVNEAGAVGGGVGDVDGAAAAAAPRRCQLPTVV